MAVEHMPIGSEKTPLKFIYLVRGIEDTNNQASKRPP